MTMGVDRNFNSLTRGNDHLHIIVFDHLPRLYNTQKRNILDPHSTDLGTGGNNMNEHQQESTLLVLYSLCKQQGQTEQSFAMCVHVTGQADIEREREGVRMKEREREKLERERGRQDKKEQQK